MKEEQLAPKNPKCTL